jgi:hypothetical protein
MDSYDKEEFFEDVNKLEEFKLTYKKITRRQLETIRRIGASKSDSISTRQGFVKKVLRPGLMFGLTANIGIQMAQNPALTEKVLGVPQKTLTTLSIALSTIVIAGLLNRQVSDTKESQEARRLDKVKKIVRKEIEKYEPEPNWKKL